MQDDVRDGMSAPHFASLSVLCPARKHMQSQMQAGTCGTTQLRLLNLFFGAIILPLFYAAHRQLHPVVGAGRSLGMVTPPCVHAQQCLCCCVVKWHMVSACGAAVQCSNTRWPHHPCSGLDVSHDPRCLHCRLWCWHCFRCTSSSSFCITLMSAPWLL